MGGMSEREGWHGHWYEYGGGVRVTKTLKTHNLVSGSVGISGLRLNSKYILT